MEIVTVAEMRELERAADAAGLSYAQMMHSAGVGAAHAILARLAAAGVALPGANAVALVGPGNNGGDGLVCAAELARAGLHVQAYLLRRRATDDAVLTAARAAGVAVMHADEDGDGHRLRRTLADADVAIDAVLGTGAARPIDGALRDLLTALAHARPRLIIALDGPTGMNYDTGALDPAAVPADLTLTFHAPKRGHYCYPAAAACGATEVIDIGIRALPLADIDNRRPVIRLADHALVRSLLPRRAADGNKGTHGKALIVAGCADYRGAPTLAARAAYRTGAGLVAYAVPQAAATVAAIACPEATFVPLPDSVDAHTPASIGRVSAWLAGAGAGAAIAIGPGLGTAADTAAFLDGLWGVLAAGERRIAGLVCDADALNHLAAREGWPRCLPASSVLTPHPGEMARLTKLGITAIQADRIGTALRFSAEWGHVVLLKGAHTVIAAPDGHAAVLPFANPAMAVAGMGDVLTGCIVALLAQGLAPFEAAVAGGYVHGMAGQLWLNRHGDAGLLAGDVIELLPDALRDIKRPLTDRS